MTETGYTQDTHYYCPFFLKKNDVKDQSLFTHDVTSNYSQAPIFSLHCPLTCH